MSDKQSKRRAFLPWEAWTIPWAEEHGQFWWGRPAWVNGLLNKHGIIVWSELK